MSVKPAHYFEFGEFRLESERLCLRRRNGEAVHLTPKALEILLLLVQNQGRTVTRGELLETVWKDTFIEEGNINFNISLLRKALRQNGASETEFIKTVPKEGYRFVADVREIIAENGTGEKAAVFQTGATAARRLKESNLKPQIRWHFIAIVLLGVFFVTSFGWWWRLNDQSSSANGSSETRNIKSIAVLPFKTVDAAQSEHQGLGLADVLITRLSNIKTLNVRPTSAIAAFENQEIDSTEAGRRLQADAVLEGTIYRAAGQIRVTVRLLRTSDSRALWAGQFEKPLSDELRIQDEIALQVTDALALDLSVGERSAVSKPLTENADALALYQKGRFEWNKRSFQGSAEAERLFRNAIEKDPNFALAYVGLADTIAMRNSADEAYTAIGKALEIDPNLAEAHATLGFLKMFHEWNWQESESELKKAVELNPNYSTAHHWYANLLELEGRNTEAKAEFGRALEINPVSYNFLADLGQAFYFNREYAEAEQYCRKALEIYPDFVFAHGYLYRIYLKTGDFDAAIKEQLKSDEIALSFANQPADAKTRREKALAARVEAYKNGNIRAFFADQLRVRDLSADSQYGAALIYAFSGEKAKALDALENAYAGKSYFGMPFVKADPTFDTLRDEPRYKEILRKMNL